jgi:hypothetical protein
MFAAILAATSTSTTSPDWTFGVLIATAVLALFTATMAGFTGWLGWQSKRDADASIAMGKEMRADRELAVQPFLVLTSGLGNQVDSVNLGNIGRGPALIIMLFTTNLGVVHWRQHEFAALREGTATDPDQPIRLTGQIGVGHQDAPRAYIELDGKTRTVAYCCDQLGNYLRFDLRTGEPPDVWRRGEEPKPWALAWEYASK